MSIEFTHESNKFAAWVWRIRLQVTKNLVTALYRAQVAYFPYPHWGG